MNGQGVTARWQRAKYVVSDWLMSNIAFLLFNICRYQLLRNEFDNGADLQAFLFSGKLLIEQAIVPFVMTGVFWLSGYYNQPFGKSRLQELLTTIYSALVNTTLIYLVLLINDQTGIRTLNYEMLLSLFGLMFLPVYLSRFFITKDATSCFRSHKWEMRTLMIGNSNVARQTARQLLIAPSRMSYDIAGYVNIPGETVSEETGEVYSLEDINGVCKRLRIDVLIIAPENINDDKILTLLYHLYPLNISIKIAPDTYSFITSAIRLKDIYGEPFVDLTSPSISEASKNIKRTCDVVISLILLILLSPVYLVIAGMVKFDSSGRIIYSQERIGRKQKPFRIYKFRTMREDAEREGPQLSGDSDPRITRVGKRLRKYRLDELPQFWNVVKGDMSIVGPRPERRFYIDKIMERAPYYALVYQVRPGITSWGMVKYGYASNLDQMVERTRYDLIYISNMSLSLDMKILIYTVSTVLGGKGI